MLCTFFTWIQLVAFNKIYTENKQFEDTIYSKVGASGMKYKNIKDSVCWCLVYDLPQRQILKDKTIKLE
ncbi:hypothetical protein ACVNPZ_02050 [Staphylococcus aureus]